VAGLGERYSYIAWTLPDPTMGIMLFAGRNNDQPFKTSTIGCTDCPPTFTLKHDAYRACAINLGHSLVVTGGGGGGGEIPIQSSVDSYTVSGDHTALPDMKHARNRHACGSYTATDGGKVLLVTGGRGGYPDGFGAIDKTEILHTNSDTWKYAARLPRRMENVQIATLENTILLAGGWWYEDGDQTTDEVLEYQPSTDEWLEAGKMYVPRIGHAIVAVPDITAFCGGQ